MMHDVRNGGSSATHDTDVLSCTRKSPRKRSRARGDIGAGPKTLPATMPTTRLRNYLDANFDSILARCRRDAHASGVDTSATCASILRAVLHGLDGQGSHDGAYGSFDRLTPAAESISDPLHAYGNVRASFTRIWLEDRRDGTPDIDALVAFDDALDRHLAHTVKRYEQRVQEEHDVFIGILAHDLRNPLHAIMMTAAALQRRDGIEDGVADALRRIGGSGGRMDRLVRDLLEYARVRTRDVMPLHVTSCNLEAILRTTTDELRAVHPDRRIVLSVDGDTTGQWDADRLAQVISNLAGNALEHGEGDTPVVIDLSSVGNNVRLLVHNRGPVLPASVLRICTARLDDARVMLRQPSIAGLGLGLFIVRAIVSAHGGTIEATSDLTRGTLFNMCLPRETHVTQPLQA